jgi:hypothetical protein
VYLFTSAPRAPALTWGNRRSNIPRVAGPGAIARAAPNKKRIILFNAVYVGGGHQRRKRGRSQLRCGGRFLKGGSNWRSRGGPEPARLWWEG